MGNGEWEGGWTTTLTAEELPMRNRKTRRSFLNSMAAGGVATWLYRTPTLDCRSDDHTGFVVGEPTGEKVGLRILADGGNAVDAIVAAALASAVAAPNQTGPGGYGAHGVFAVAGGSQIYALDANSAAPAALQSDTFKPDARGAVAGRTNEHGWLAAGVPGILAGLQLALDRFGTWKFAEVVAPAIDIARTGFPWPAGLASVVAGSRTFAADRGSQRVYFRDGRPLPAGARFTNPELADMLASLGRSNSVDRFYRGDIAQQIADAFRQNGGLVTANDLAAYQARIVTPVAISVGRHTIHTAPLTAGGSTVLQVLMALQAMNWSTMPAGPLRTLHQLEAMRVAWHDRLTSFGDPDFVAIPQQRLLSAEYGVATADRVAAAIAAGRPIACDGESRDHNGTISLSAVDRHGNFAALTLTHGNAFGAQVTVDGLGVTLGQGMYRFDPRADHPNSPGPGKRPLNNMSPTIVTRDNAPVLAIGGRGGRKIPNSMIVCLAQFVLLDRPLTESIAAPRLHTEGTTTVEFENGWPASETAELTSRGYVAKSGGSATLSAVAREKERLVRAMR